MCEFVPLRRNDLEVDTIDYGTHIGVFFKDRCVLNMTYDETLELIADLVHSAAIVKESKK